VTQKHAIITPLIKKSTLDTSVLNRPVSNLTFMSKVLERIVADQLLRYLHEHDHRRRHHGARAPTLICRGHGGTDNRYET